MVVVLVGFWYLLCLCIGGDGGIANMVVVLIVMAVVRVAVVIRSNSLYFCGVICGVGSGSGINSSFGGSSIAYHHHYPSTQPPPSKPALPPISPHVIHLTMGPLVILMEVAMIGL